MGPTLGAVDRLGLTADIETLRLDRGSDYPVIERRLTQLGLDDTVIAKRTKKGVLPLTSRDRTRVLSDRI